ncbi:MAG: alpha-amylase [Chitinophagaceae bacterium]|nr:alpha-amylase [Chitinophagaceae bacterium]
MATNSGLLNDQLHWYKDAIIYELHIKAFCDSNGDGIGDFGGLIEKLDYLQELGVTAVWVLPFYPSPLKDDGYDIADYYSINSSYGNISQFRQFLEEAHKRKLKVITELVINHTSDQHPWFQRARIAPKGSTERNFYVWTDDPNQYKDVRIIFQDFEASNWTWDPVAQQYYWHRFFHHQPDLNYDSNEVQAEIFKIIDYWCEMGVDGFRLDAVPYLFEREGTNGENLPETHVFLKKLRKHIDEKFPSTVFLAEANMWPEDSASYFGDGDECHMNYHFPVMPRMFMALQMEDRFPITDIFEQTPEIPETCQWAMFLRNHDELTLEMVTDEERDYMYKVYAKDPKARINLGIRHRLAPLLDNNRRKIELLNCLLFSLPGTPVIYYGDEIGMGDNFYLGDRDGVRTPMQWTADRNAGFSNANPHKLYLPLILDPEYYYESVNVDLQRRNTSSLFWYMKRMITMRKKYKAFGRGSMEFINVENPKVLAFTRTYGEETILVVANLSKFPQPAEVDLHSFSDYIPVEVFSKNKFPAIKEGSPYFFTLGPHAFQWFVLEKKHVITETESLASLQVSSWDDLMNENSKEQLETNILPVYLTKKARWFEGRRKSIYNIQVSAAAFMLDAASYFLLVEVNYHSGLPETYLLPLAFIQGEEAEALRKDHPGAIICKVKCGEEEGLLCDALFTEATQQLLIKKLGISKSAEATEESIAFYASDDLQRHVEKNKVIKSRIHPSDTSNTSITYDNCFFLKVYRKVDKAVNPDVEISRYLTEQVKFEHTPGFIGSVEWKFTTDTIVLAMMQVMVENHGDGYGYMLERLNNYIERILSRDWKNLHPEKRTGTLTEPVGFEELPEDLQVLIGGPVAEHARLLGKRTGEMHLALAASTYIKEFRPEEFSLHYQRSLFSSMQSLVRETYDVLSRQSSKTGALIEPDIKTILSKKTEVLDILRRIYRQKFDVLKTRIHGNYHLGQVLLTGKDISIHNFGGNPSRSYSEGRLKRSPLKDVASMVSSFHYAAYDCFLKNNHAPKDDLQNLLPFAGMWAHYVSMFFVKSYLETIKESAFVPADKKDLEIMLQTFLLEKALYDLNYEMYHRPDWIIVPVHLLKAILNNKK